MAGCLVAGQDLGCGECFRCDIKRAKSHWMISASTYWESSVSEVYRRHIGGKFVTKDEYKALLDGVENKQDKAAACHLHYLIEDHTKTPRNFREANVHYLVKAKNDRLIMS